MQPFLCISPTDVSLHSPFPPGVFMKSSKSLKAHVMVQCDEDTVCVSTEPQVPEGDNIKTYSMERATVF